MKKLNAERRYLGWVGALVIVAFALRVFRLDASGLGYDELFSLAAGTLPYPDWMLAVLEDRVHPPGYYFLGQFWYGIGRAEFSVRYLSVCFGVLAIPVIYRLGEASVDERVGLIAAALLTVSPFHIYYSQEARMYSLVAFLALGANYFFIRLLERGKARNALGYVVLTTGGLYTHYLYTMVVLAQMVFVVLQRRTYRAMLTRWFAALIGVGALYAPWLVVVFATGGLAQAGISWIPPANLSDLALTVFTHSLGATSLVNNPIFFLVPAAYTALAIGGWIATRADKPAPRARVDFLAIWFWLPLLFVFLISLDWAIPNKRSVYHDRFFLAELPGLLLLVALGMRALWQRYPRGFVLLALGLLLPTIISLQILYFDPANARENWRDSVAYVRAQADPVRDVLAIYAGAILPLAYYEPGTMRRIVVWVPSDEALNAFDEQFAALNPKPAQIWFLLPTMGPSKHGFFPSWDEQRRRARADPLKRVLDQRFAVESEKLFQAVFVTRYRVVK